MKKKSLNAKKIIPSNLILDKYLKNKKIFKIYKDFEKNFKTINNPGKIAISVSGGPDSMALCFLVSCYAKKNNYKITSRFFLVDHGLRKNSSQEARIVKEKLKLNNINLKILKWRGKKPISNLQSLARNKRYQLIFNQCKKHNIKTVLTAHHQDDFYETFFSRLLRGSGTEGLSSFAEIKKNFCYKGQAITVVRPLLNLNKENLVYIAQNVFNFYIKDPSNDMEKFQRVRLRKLIKNMKNQGLNFNKLKLTLRNLSSSNKAINEIVRNNINDNVIFNQKKYIINFNFFLLPDEVIFRSLSILIRKMSKKNYPPRGKKLMNLIKEIKSGSRIKATLGGTIIEKIHNSVVVTEEKTKKP